MYVVKWESGVIDLQIWNKKQYYCRQPQPTALKKKSQHRLCKAHSTESCLRFCTGRLCLKDNVCRFVEYVDCWLSELKIWRRQLKHSMLVFFSPPFYLTILNSFKVLLHHTDFVWERFPQLCWRTTWFVELENSDLELISFVFFLVAFHQMRITGASGNGASRVNFLRNYATLRGGAIYIDHSSSSSSLLMKFNAEASLTLDDRCPITFKDKMRIPSVSWLGLHDCGTGTALLFKN